MKNLIAHASIAASLVACSSASEPKHIDTVSPGGCMCAPVVSPASVSLMVHTTAQITATDRITPNSAWRWTSRDTTIAFVTQTGIVTALRGGTTSVIATEVRDTSMRASAIVTVSSVVTDSKFDPILTSISDVATGRPTNLSALSGSVAVGVQIGWPTAGSIGPAQLVVRRSSGDTVVASVNAPTQPSGDLWTGSLVWNTAARTSAGTPAFPNGSYQILFRTTINGVAVTSTGLTASVTNP